MKITRLLPVTLLFLASISTQAQYNFYYGNLHSHTSFSDGSKDSTTSGISTPYQAYQYAKASLNFDFLGISEHNHATAGMSLANYHKGVQQAESANEDSVFVALFGMEWGTISSGGHVLVYGIDSLLNWEPNNYDIYVPKGQYPQLWDAINARPGAFAMCCHPKNTDFHNIRSGLFSTSANLALVGTAFRSGPAFSSNTTYTNPSSSSFESYFKALLAKGYHVGPTYDHDNHNTTFGRTTDGRLVAVAPALTRANLMHAFRNRNFYASDDCNAQVMLTANNDYLMGAIVNQLQPPNIRVTLNDPDAENYNSFQLLKGRPGDGQNAIVITSGTAGTMAINYTDNDLQVGDSAYYYVSITQDDGDRIITSPIWYSRGTLVNTAIANQEAPKSLVLWPNPVNSDFDLLTVSAPENGSIIILDALGREAKSSITQQNVSVIEKGSLTPGLYIIQWRSEKGEMLSERLIVR